MSTPLLPLLIYVSAGLVRHGRSQQPSLADAIRYVAELTEIIEAAQTQTPNQSRGKTMRTFGKDNPMDFASKNFAACPRSWLSFVARPKRRRGTASATGTGIGFDRTSTCARWPWKLPRRCRAGRTRFGRGDSRGTR